MSGSALASPVFLNTAKNLEMLNTSSAALISERLAAF
jgi:hypothetical protein